MDISPQNKGGQNLPLFPAPGAQRTMKPCPHVVIKVPGTGYPIPPREQRDYDNNIAAGHSVGT